ncbi:uncharacterized protein RMCFA_0461 [Mycolicibacterium fortuitum subsp. acetamidolyticum]|uniref:Uncharacterized protein n=1 Tax=Mycolicibacterium fortuitum subsp. acetamidolyticum TaxID=144550 RepID=A0A100WLF8_MYCFO|nr:uncharacterized protein RMCFA_0461 [Mycolicibacterium fortuitum subsp. acetamidolyticum]
MPCATALWIGEQDELTDRPTSDRRDSPRDRRPAESCKDGAVSDEPRFVDVVNPTPDEIRAWAYSGAFEPMQDWDLVIADVDNLQLLLELIGDQACPARDYLLGSLYCLFGHSDRTDPRLLSAADAAQTGSDPWIATWGRRVCRVVENPSEFNRADWCDWDGYRLTPNG